MRHRLLLAVLAAVVSATPVSSLTDEEIFRDFRFNLINPGGRSLGLGGAFISLADDATAARANPAGLAFLRRWEFFSEIRSIDNAASSSIRAETLPTGVETSVAVGSDLDDVVSPSFLSGVKNFERWTLGLSRGEELNQRNDTLSGFTFSFPDNPGRFLTEGQGFVDVEVINYNISGGVRITDNLSLGLTLTYSELDVQSEVRNVVLDIGGNVAGTDVLVPTLDLRTSTSDGDSDTVFSAGILYKVPDVLQLGAVYRKGSDFTVDQRVDPPVMNGMGQVTAGIDLFDVRGNVGEVFPNTFSLPDVWGLGTSLFFLENSKLVLSVDYERVEYSSLSTGLIPGVNVLTDFDARFETNDASIVRAGAEYLLLPQGGKLPPLALRGGLFLDEDSTIRARSTGTNSFATEAAFAGRDDELHGAIGLGIILPRYKIDLAADFSSISNQYLISLIYQGK